MVKSSKKLTKVLCFLLIMCLATSMVVVSSMCTAQAQAQTTASPLQTAILKAMNLDDGSRKDFATEVLETTAVLKDVSVKL
jgi:Na+-transporting NADH:ubiquinone oxidoreductase subunit NqrC